MHRTAISSNFFIFVPCTVCWSVRDDIPTRLLLAESADRDLADYLIGDVLENVVSAFDGYGREISARKSADIHFQNLLAARRKVQETLAVDFADAVETEDWELACRAFQKRHLLAHKMGVIPPPMPSPLRLPA